MEFNNTPFIVAETRKLDCQFGEHYFKERVRKNTKRIILQGTRKIGCLAKVIVKQLNLFPEYSISANLLNKKQLRNEREKQLLQLKEDLANCKVTVHRANKYFVSLPTKEAHNHPVGPGVAGFAQKIHPKLVSKIHELVSEGITAVPEIKRILRNYVSHTLCIDILPSDSDRSYYPTNTDISNHVYQAKRCSELSKLDQENLDKKIDGWKSLNVNSKFYFRPYIENEKEINGNISETSSKAPMQGRFFGNNAANNELKIVEINCSQSLLYAHQEQWQQRLMEMYGNTISLIDATYKTTKYDLALFFIAVRTNVGYMVVAEFIIQSESAEEISEALSILKQWNPNWKPKYFMSDYSEAELCAIEQVFPGCKVYLCDFHREQAWERWVQDKNHNLDAANRNELLSLLRDCAWAPPARSEKVPINHSYEKAVTKLKESCVWKENEAVQNWLSTKWLPLPEVCRHITGMYI